MRLTLDVIGSAEQLLGPNKERVLSLRGLKIPAIENFGATGDLFDVVDLCDNSLIRLDNFPPLQRLETLLLANNRIAKLDADILHNIPKLKSIILTNNRLALLGDIIPLTKGKFLERLSLLDNPVRLRPYYQEYLIYRIPTLRFLDFTRVTDAERLAATKLFHGTSGDALLAQIEGESSTDMRKQDALTSSRSQQDTTFNKSLDVSSSQPTPVKKITNGEVAMIKEAIAQATNLSEIQRLETALRKGICPPEFRDQEDTKMH